MPRRVRASGRALQPPVDPPGPRFPATPWPEPKGSWPVKPSRGTREWPA